MDIVFKDVDYIYDPNTPVANIGLKNINLTITGGSYTAIIGHTGSGKSTLLQHLNALLKPTHGTVTIGDRVITPETNNKNLKPLRKKVGIVFQFAEHQLFEESVGKDIAFGPTNFGVNVEDALKIAHRTLKVVGLSDEYFDRSPFDLSGGQMRRVAIAGVLALEPEILVLDEPTAGLDPASRQDMMALFARLHTQEHLTVVLVTHQMDDVVNYAEKVLVMAQGQLIRQGTPSSVFTDTDFVMKHHLGLPSATKFAQALQRKGWPFEQLPLTEKQLADSLAQKLQRGGVHHG